MTTVENSLTMDWMMITYWAFSMKYRRVLKSASNGDFMIQTTDGAFDLIENMASSSANKNQKSDGSKKVNSVDTQKIYELKANVDQLLKNNQGKIFVMEEATTEQIQNNQEISPGDEKKGNDQQEVNYINGHGYVQNNQA